MSLLAIAGKIGGQLASNVLKAKATSYVSKKGQEALKEAKKPQVPSYVSRYQEAQKPKYPEAQFITAPRVSAGLQEAIKKREENKYGKLFVGPTKEEAEKSIFTREGITQAMDVEISKLLKGLGLVSGERELSKMFLDKSGEYLRSFVSGVTLGISEAAGKYETTELEPLTAQGKLAKRLGQPMDTALKTSANLGGSFLPYGAISRGVAKVISKAPMFAKFAKPLSETASRAERAKRFAFYAGVANLGEEGVDMTVRKLTGQNYTEWDFATGMLLGGVFEGVANFRAKDLKSLLKKIPSKAKKEIAQNVESFAKTHDRPPSGEDLMGIFGRVQSGTTTVRRLFEDSAMFKEARMLGLKPKSYDDYVQKQIVREAPKAPETDIATSIQKAKAEGKSFDEWVKGRGEPVYHGTNVEFNTFDKAKLGVSTKAKSAEKGFWFVDNKDVAKGYGEYASEKPVRDILDQIKIEEKKGNWDRANELTIKAEELSAEYANPIVIEARLNLKNPMVYDAKGKGFLATDKKVNDLIDKAIKKGNDGLIIKNLEDNVYSANVPATHTIVFNDKTIKTRAQLKAEWDKAGASYAEQAFPEVMPGMKNKGKFAQLSEGVEPPKNKLKDLQIEVGRRKEIEQLIREGKYDLVSPEEMLKVRKSGGLINDVIGKIDELPGKALTGAARGVVKLAEKATPDTVQKWAKRIFSSQQNITDKVFKEIKLRKKAEGKEAAIVKDLMEPLEGFNEAKRVEASKFLLGKENNLTDADKKLLQPIRDEIDIEGLRQVEIGNLKENIYFENMGKYMRRLYKVHGVEEFVPAVEKYEALKKALIDERGVTSEKADEVITEIAVGNLKEVNKGYIKPSGTSIKGNFLKKRKLGEDKVSLAIRDFLGEIKDPVYLAERTLFELKKSRLNYQYLEALKKTGAVTPDRPPIKEIKDWTKLESENWGPLRDQWIRKEVKDQIDLAPKPSGAAGKAMDVLSWANAQIKANLTVRNLPGQIRNLVSNFGTSQAILGHNFISVRGLDDFRKAIKSIKNKDNFYKELKAYGEIGDINIRKDLGMKLEDILNKKTTTKSSVIKTWRKLDDVLGKAYESGDNFFLMANYKKLRAKGMTPVEAIAQARRVTPDYGDVNPVIDGLRKNLIGVPFLTWRYKVYPELFKAMLEHPVRSTGSVAIPAIATHMAWNSLGDMTEEEKKMSYTKLWRDGQVTLPFRDKGGDLAYVNFSEYTPFADAFRARYTQKDELVGALPDQLQGYAKGWLPGVGSFPLQMWINLNQNYDPFLQKPIFKEGSSWDEKLLDGAVYLSQPLLPVLGSPTKYGTKALQKEEPVGEALVRGFTGLRVESPGVGKFEAMEKYRDNDFSLDENETVIRQTIVNLAEVGDTNPDKANEILDRLYDQYPEYEDFIKTRVRAEKDKITNKTANQRNIREEVKSIANISKIDPDKANKRLEELYNQYPEYEEYIAKKVTEAK